MHNRRTKLEPSTTEKEMNTLSFNDLQNGIVWQTESTMEYVQSTTTQRWREDTTPEMKGKCYEATKEVARVGVRTTDKKGTTN